ncbi:hypothetical protein LTR23_000992 [Exophiala sp. CCFEE 6169]|nr:hypothetical protein LTR23_000992 [Chaetothyriales sp. CCFEE 6169]
METPTAKKRRRGDTGELNHASNSSLGQRQALTTSPSSVMGAHFTNPNDMVDPALLNPSPYRYVTDITDTDPLGVDTGGLQDFDSGVLEDPFGAFDAHPSDFVSLMKSVSGDNATEMGMHDTTFGDSLLPQVSQATIQPEPLAPASSTSSTSRPPVITSHGAILDDWPEDHMNHEDFIKDCFSVPFTDPDEPVSKVSQSGPSSKKDSTQPNGKTSKKGEKSLNGSNPVPRSNSTVKTPKNKPTDNIGRAPASAPPRTKYPTSASSYGLGFPPTSGSAQRRPSTNVSPKSTPIRGPSAAARNASSNPAQRQPSMNTTSFDHTLNNIGMSPPPAKRARSNTTNGSDLLTNSNTHQDSQNDATDDLLSGFRAYLEEKKANPPNINQLVANFQAQQERQPPRVMGVGVVFPLSTYFSDPANHANFKWLGRKFGNPDPPPSLIRQMTGYDFPIPSVSGVLYPMAQAHEMMEKRRARAMDVEVGMGIDNQFNGQMGMDSHPNGQMGMSNLDQSFGPGPANHPEHFHPQSMDSNAGYSNAGYLHPQMQAQPHGQFPQQMRHPGRTPPLQPSPMTPGGPHTGMGFPQAFSGRQMTPTPSQRRPSLMRQCSTVSPTRAPAQDHPGQYQGQRPSLPNMSAAAPSTNIMNGVGSYLPNQHTNPIPKPQGTRTPARGPYQLHAASPPGSASSQYSAGNTPPAWRGGGNNLPNLSTTPTGPVPDVNPFDNIHIMEINPCTDMNHPKKRSPRHTSDQLLDVNTEAALRAVGADVVDFAPAATNAVLPNPVPPTADADVDADAATTNAATTTSMITPPRRHFSGYDGANSGTSTEPCMAMTMAPNMNMNMDVTNTDTDGGLDLFTFNPFPFPFPFDSEGDGIDLDGWSFSDGLLLDEERPFNAQDWGL